MNINIDDIKCFHVTGNKGKEINIKSVEYADFYNLLVSIVIAFERVQERAPKFVVFNNTLSHRLMVMVYRADITEADIDPEQFWTEDRRILCIRKDLDEQAEANAIDDGEPWVKFEVI